MAPSKAARAAPASAGGDPCKIDRLGGAIFPTDSKLSGAEQGHPLDALTEMNRVMADWRAHLQFRLAIADICFHTIGLTDEKLDELTHEVRCFKRVCFMLGERVPGSLTASKGRRAA